MQQPRHVQSLLGELAQYLVALFFVGGVDVEVLRLAAPPPPPPPPPPFLVPRGPCSPTPGAPAVPGGPRPLLAPPCGRRPPPPSRPPLAPPRGHPTLAC